MISSHLIPTFLEQYLVCARSAGEPGRVFSVHTLHAGALQAGGLRARNLHAGALHAGGLRTGNLHTRDLRAGNLHARGLRTRGLQRRKSTCQGSTHWGSTRRKSTCRGSTCRGSRRWSENTASETWQQTNARSVNKTVRAAWARWEEQQGEHGGSSQPGTWVLTCEVEHGGFRKERMRQGFPRRVWGWGSGSLVLEVGKAEAARSHLQSPGGQM